MNQGWHSNLYNAFQETPGKHLMRHVFRTRLCKDVGVEAAGAGVAVAVSFQPRYNGPASWAGGVVTVTAMASFGVGVLATMGWHGVCVGPPSKLGAGGATGESKLTGSRQRPSDGARIDG